MLVEQIHVLAECIQTFGEQKNVLGERIHSIRERVNPIAEREKLLGERSERRRPGGWLGGVLAARSRAQARDAWSVGINRRGVVSESLIQERRSVTILAPSHAAATARSPTKR